jgi:hypothetical protein
MKAYDQNLFRLQIFTKFCHPNLGVHPDPDSATAWTRIKIKKKHLDPDRMNTVRVHIRNTCFHGVSKGTEQKKF